MQISLAIKPPTQPTPIQRAISTITGMFAAGEQGAWYDPSDLSTLFQDSAGTTPVTAVEQPVGRMLDKSGRGNHAIQATAINRPVLSARVNLFTETEFRNGVTDAPVRGGLVSATTLTGYLGAIAFGHDGVATNYAYKNPFALSVIGRVYTLSVVVAMTDGLAPTFNAATNLSSFSLVIAGDALSFNLHVVANLGGGLYRVSGTYTATTTSPNFGVVKYAGNSNRTFKVTAYHLELGAVATRYQGVTTATDYDTVGFKRYLAFNGTNSSMSTAAINFTGTDKMTVCAGVRKLSDAVQGCIAELATGAGNGTFAVWSPPFVNSGFAVWSKGTVLASNAYTATPLSPVTNVLTGICDISGDRATLRLNGTQVAQATTDQGTGNYGNHSIYIGARNNSSFFLNGNLYGLIIRGAASSTTQIAATEFYMNNRTGAY